MHWEVRTGKTLIFFPISNIFLIKLICDICNQIIWWWCFTFQLCVPSFIWAQTPILSRSGSKTVGSCFGVSRSGRIASASARPFTPRWKVSTWLTTTTSTIPMLSYSWVARWCHYTTSYWESNFWYENMILSKHIENTYIFQNPEASLWDGTFHPCLVCTCYLSN